MAEHIILFSNIDDENYADPKDKLSWNLENEDKNQYETDEIDKTKRFIIKPNGDFKEFMRNYKFPEKA